MKEYECVIIGAGPAGLGAAIAARKFGVQVLVVDENQLPGGQLFKQIHKFFGSSEHMAGTRGFIIGQKLLKEAEELGVEVWLDTRAWSIFDGNVVGLLKEGKTVLVSACRLIVATGATENAIAFEGCTKPGVMTAGAAQTLINIHRVLPGKRILMVGSGNVGLIVSYQLMQAGAEVLGIVEAGSGVTGYEVHANKIRRAGVPFYFRHTVARAEGRERVERALVAPVDGNFNAIEEKGFAIEVDTVCLGVGLSPRIELLQMTDTRFLHLKELGGYLPVHDEHMAVGEAILAAGDVTGVEEASSALDEGRLAGLSVAFETGKIDGSRYDEERGAVQARLDTLRSGFFGEKRALAKQKILRKARASC